VEGLDLVSRGTLPADPVAANLVRRWEAGAGFHREESTKTAVRALWQANSAALSASLASTAEQLTGLVKYLQDAGSAGAAADPRNPGLAYRLNSRRMAELSGSTTTVPLREVQPSWSRKKRPPLSTSNRSPS
jgi:hypothetical protein